MGAKKELGQGSGHMVLGGGTKRGLGGWPGAGTGGVSSHGPKRPKQELSRDIGSKRPESKGL